MRREQTCRSQRRVAGAATGWILIVVAAAFAVAAGAGSKGSLVGVALCVVLLPQAVLLGRDLAAATPPPDPAPRQRHRYRDPLLAAVLGAGCGIAAAISWHWISARADACPPAAPFGGCGGEKILPLFGAGPAIGIIVLVLALLRVQRAVIIGLAAAPTAAAVIATYNAFLPGSPAPGPTVAAVLTMAGFLLAWAGNSRAVPAAARVAVLTGVPAMILLGA